MADTLLIITSFREQLFEALNVEHFPNIDVLLGTLDAVQEQPQLLDPYIEELITPILSTLSSALSDQIISRFQTDLYHILYTFTKIRGSKVISESGLLSWNRKLTNSVKFFPNHVHLLEPLMACLTAQPSADRTLWHARYVLLLWLSLISMTPFDLRSFDGESTSSSAIEGRIEIVDRLITLAKSYLDASGREREAAGLLIARILTRKDVNHKYIPAFLEQNLLIWNADSCTIAFRIGFLTCLCEVFRIGNRDVLLAHTQNAFTAITSMERSEQLHTSTTLRKLRIKLAQRVALALLRPSRAEWRYKSVNNSQDIDSLGKDEDLDSSDPPVELEDIVGLLLGALNDKDTIVRYSAAKGIGRLTSRLPLAYAEEIINAVLDTLRTDVLKDKTKFRIREEAKETLWQGSCLALAELCRNGALLPVFLKDVLDLTLLAITFDIRKGSHSVGTSVRDAACYVMWSILRCFSTAILETCSDAIATTLITVAMFDREVSVRRAASAAYQEGAGRHTDRIFPHRIAVLSTADFYAVGQRRMSFLEVSPAVFEYDEYKDAILVYLSTVSCQHWDREIRELAGRTFRVLIKKFARHNSSISRILTLLSTFHDARISIDANLRHGAFFAVGEIAAGLHEAQISPEAQIKQDFLLFPRDLSQNNKKGPQAPLIMSAVCHCTTSVVELINQPAACGDQVSVLNSEAAFQEMLDDCLAALGLADENTRLEASTAAATILECSSMHEYLNMTLSHISTKSDNAIVRRGQLTLLGRIKYTPGTNYLARAIDILLLAAQPEVSAYRDSCETRKVAVTSLGALSTQLNTAIPRADLAVLTERLTTSFTLAFEDYTVDARGDIGSWVRDAAVGATSQLLSTPAAWQTSILQDKDHLLFKNLVRGGLSQCVGKIENLRSSATAAISHMLENTLQLDSIETSTRRLIEEVSPALASAATQVATSGSSLCVFEHCVQLLLLEDYRSTLLKGYLVSGGSGAQSTMSVATDTLAKFLEVQSPDVLTLILHATEDIIRDAKTNDRVLIPALMTTASLFDSEVFPSDLPYDYSNLFSVVQTVTTGSRAIGKIGAALRIYASLALLDRPAVRARAWKKLALSLGHTFAGVRVLAAELLYTVLTTIALDDDDHQDEEEQEVETILTQQDWSQRVDATQLEKVKHYLDKSAK